MKSNYVKSFSGLWRTSRAISRLNTKTETGTMMTYNQYTYTEDGILYIHQQHPEKLFPRYRATVWNDNKLTRQVEMRKKKLLQYFFDENGENQLFSWKEAKERRGYNKWANLYAEREYRWETFSIQEEAFEDPKQRLNKKEAETLLYISQHLYNILKR